MSWRIVILPAYFDSDLSDVSGANEVVPLDATDDYMDGIAKKWAWRLPLKVWTPSKSDPRYTRLMKILDEIHLMDPDLDVTTYVKEIE